MSIFALTPSIIRTLQQDFRSGQWGSGTQQFFQQLLDRLGGTSAPTINEIVNVVAEITNILTTVVVPDFDLVPQSEASSGSGSGLSSGADVSPVREVLGTANDLTPRSEVFTPGLNISSVTWP